MAEQNTRLAQEANTSQNKTSEAAIKAIYKVISKYNGVVRKIIETIEPVKGPWSTRKSVDQSTISYYAQVLKGLIEPLKHLMFQISKTNDPTLSSMTTMLDNLVKMIDMAPPFSMIDSAAYKQGTFDYTGLSDDMNIGDISQYIDLLVVRLRSLEQQQENYNPYKKSSFKHIPLDRREDMKQTIQKTYDDLDTVINKTLDEIKKAKDMRKNKLVSFEINKGLLQEQNNVEDSLAGAFLPVSKNHNPNFDADEMLDLYNGMESTESLLKKQDKEDRAKIEKELKDLKIKFTALEKMGTKDGVFDQQNLEDLDQMEEYTNVASSISRLERELEKKTVGAVSKKDVGTASGNCGSGIDVNVTQQYNMMGRPVSNDQKINNDMINANRNWQIKNNPPHDTPIGNLNPFLAQNDASKYTYEVLLANQNAEIHPEVNALGANISLLQGPITNMSGSGKKSKAMDKIEKIAIDEKNDMHKPMEMGDKGYIPEEKEDQFKLPDLKPKKRK
jgi:hypothetical protein